jgi:hypothetical protein
VTPARFEAAVMAMTQLRFVVVPKEAGARLRAGTRTTVRARVLGLEFDSTLTPVRAGGHRLFIPATVWKARGLAIGDVIPVEIWRVNPAPVVMPAELEELARTTPALADAYAAISPSDRRQVEKYLARIVSPETRSRWIDRLATKLLSPRPRKPRRTRA